MNATGKFVLGLVLLVALSIFGGWVLSILWGWFMVPIFGLVALKLSEAIGLSLVVGALAKSHVPDRNEGESLFAWMLDRLFEYVLYGLLLLLTGWVVQHFV